MKIIHCADLHLDSPFSNMPGEKASRRREELLLAFKRMIDYADDNSIFHIIIAGDLFDKKRPSMSAINFVLSTISKHPEITFYYLKGNHDGKELFHGEKAYPDNLKLFGDSWVYYENDIGPDGKKLVICGCEDMSDTKNAYPEGIDYGNINIAVLHGNISDNSAGINIKNLQNRGIDYLALGHIHSYSLKELDRRGVMCYSGCLESRGFDECCEHGFVVLDIDNEEGIINYRRVDLSIRNMSRMMVDISGCHNSAEILEKVRGEIEVNNYSPDDMLMVKLTGATDIECDRNIHMIEQYLANNFFLVRVYDESEYMVNAQDYCLDESLKGEFVRLVMAVDSLSDEEKAEIVRTGIRALRGEAID